MVSLHTRSRLLVCVLSLVLGVAWGSPANAQGLSGADLPGGSFLGSVPGLGSFDVGGMRLTPNVRVGFQWMGLNFNLPTLDALQFGPTGAAPIDIQLKDARVWVGSVGLEAQLSPALSLFVNAEANAKRTASAVTSDDPLRAVPLLLPAEPNRWDASQLEWWAVEGGVAYSIMNDVALLGGLRRDHLSFGLDNPRDAFGNPVNLGFSIPGIILANRTAAADFQLKLLVPYLGLRFTGDNYRGSLSWSPFANAAVKVPDHFIRNLSVLPLSLFTFSEALEWKYSMFRTGTQFEGALDYDLRLSSNFSIKAWAKGTWLRVRGKGNLDELAKVFVSVLGTPVLFDSISGGNSATATLTTYRLAMGLGAELNF
jgi:hypothetical protein